VTLSLSFHEVEMRQVPQDELQEPKLPLVHSVKAQMLALPP
jgi:hypothetical protein